jgi:hypothetical protein
LEPYAGFGLKNDTIDTIPIVINNVESANPVKTAVPPGIQTVVTKNKATRAIGPLSFLIF